MTRVVITGATGAIGTALIRQLIKNKCEIIVVCHRESGRNKRLKEFNLSQVIECNIDELAKLPQWIDKPCDLFYHMAWAATTGMARDDVRLQVNNVQCTIDAVETAAALRCKRFIGCGSQAEYGRHEGKLNENTIVLPETGYGMAKLAAGHLSRLRCEQLGLEHIWARILSVYGPGDTETSMVMAVIRELLRKKSPSCTKGEQIWDFLYSEDAAKALLLLGNKGKSGETYLLGGGRGKRLQEYIEKIRQTIAECEGGGQPIDVPEVNYGAIPYGKNQVMHLEADISKINRDTGFVPEVTFAEGIRKTVEWCRKEYT